MKRRMKQTLAIFLTVSMVTSLLGVSAFAAEETATEGFPEAVEETESQAPKEPEVSEPAEEPGEVVEPSGEAEEGKTPEAEASETPEAEESAEPAGEESQPETPVETEAAVLPEVIETGLDMMSLEIQAAVGLQEMVEAGGLVRLGQNYTESITVTGDVTLNLNGYSLTNSPGQHTIIVAPGASLTITGNGVVDNVSHGKSAIYNEGSVTLEGGVYDRSREAGTLSGNGYNTVDGGNSGATLYNGGDMTIRSDVIVRQAGGKKNPDYGYQGFHSPLISNEGELAITGGNFYGGRNNVKNGAGADLEISDGTFHENLGYTVLNNGAARISGGRFISWNACVVWNEGRELTITGGNFSAVDKDGKGTRATITSVGSSTAEIWGGTFGNALINYNKDTGNAALPETVLLVQNSDGTFLVRNRTRDDDDAEAAIGDDCYSSLLAAIKAAGPGDEVVLLRDYEKELNKTDSGEDVFSSDKKLTLNLGEWQIKGYVINGGDLTITATTGGVNAPGMRQAIFNDGSLTINGGEITGGQYAVYDASGNGNRIEVNGGTLRGETHAVYSQNNTGFIAGGRFSHDVTDYCVPGMKAEGPNSDGLWEVLANEDAVVAQVGNNGYLTLAAAIQAAQNGDTVRLLKDVEETVSLSKTLTLDLNGHTLTNREAGHTVTVAAGGSLTIQGAGGIRNNASGQGAVYNHGQLRVESGTFSSAANGFALLNAGTAELTGGQFRARVENRGEGSLTIRGGSYSHPVDPSHCAPGFLPVVNGSAYGVLEADLTVTLSQTAASISTASGSNAIRLTAVVRPENVTLDKTVTWSSDNESVATVDAEGLVTAVAGGRANIIAAVGQVKANCAITVTQQSTGGDSNGGSSGGSTGGSSSGGSSGGSTGGATNGSGGGSVGEVPGGSTGGAPGGFIVPPTLVEDLEDDVTPLAGKPFLFEDVAQIDWFYETVKYVYDHGIMEGVTETLFRPYVDTTRGMIVTMLYRAEGTPEAGQAPFADVTDGQWYAKAVAWASEKGVVKGYEDGTFAPEKRISREELSAILYRYAALKGYDVTMSDQLSGFADRAQISSWALESTRWAVGVGLIQGKENGRLDPSGATSRAEGATILARFTQSYGGLNKDPED
ncbi:MAG: hypothetical protein HFF05_00480 [Oscillospiraceae bacterium]|nr:hypothetical protein [Oscillospiraceae bacterium]